MLEAGDMSHDRYETRTIIPKFETFFTYGVVVALTLASLVCVLVLTVNHTLPIPLLNFSIGVFLAVLGVALCYIMEARAIARDAARDNLWRELVESRDKLWQKRVHEVRDDIRQTARETRARQMAQSVVEDETQTLRSIKNK